MNEKIKAKIKSFFIPHIVYVLIAGLVVRLVISGFGTLRLDQGTFIAWSFNLAENGFRNFYGGWSDYLPGYLYVLWFLGKVRGIIPDVLLYKIPAILADIATGYLIYKIVKGKKGILLVSTSKGVMTGAQAKKLALGGEVLAEIF